MRIAFVSHSYPPDPGGVGVVVSELAGRLAAQGHEIEVFAHASHAAPTSKWQDRVLVRRYKVPISSKRFAVSPALFRALARRRTWFDVIHAHNFHASPPLMAALAGMRPLVLTAHYHGVGHTSAARLAHVVYRPGGKYLLRVSSRIVCVSSAEAGALTSDHPDLVGSVTIVPNGVTAERFVDARPFPVTRDVIVAAGRMEEYKQFDRIALAAEWLSDKDLVVLLGDGPARRAIDQLVRERGLTSRVRVLGRVSDDDLPRWLRTARVAVSMSRHEAFGLTVVEALAAGAPVVASDIPAHRETSVGQPSGAVRLIPADASPREIARAIDESAARGLPPGISVPSWDEAARLVLQVYESVLANQPYPS